MSVTHNVALSMAAFMPGAPGGVFNRYREAPRSLAQYVLSSYSERGYGSARVRSARVQVRRLLADARVIEDVIAELERVLSVTRPLLKAMVRFELTYCRRVLNLLNAQHQRLVMFVRGAEVDASRTIVAFVRNRARDRAPARSLYDADVWDAYEFGRGTEYSRAAGYLG